MYLRRILTTLVVLFSSVAGVSGRELPTIQGHSIPVPNERLESEPRLRPVDRALRSVEAMDGEWSDRFGSYGLDGWAYALTEWSGMLVAGGDFIYGGDTALWFIGAWNGESWVELPGFSAGLIDEVYSTADQVVALGTMGTDLVAAGRYLRRPPEGGRSRDLTRVSAWDGNQWSQFGDDILGRVIDMAVVGDEVFIAGRFEGTDELNPDLISGLLRWDGTSWEPVPGVGEVAPRDIREFDGDLVMAGPINYETWPDVGGINRLTEVGWVNEAPAPPTRIWTMERFAGEWVVWTWGTRDIPSELLRWDGTAWQPVPGGPVEGAWGEWSAGLSVRGMCVVEGELVVTGSFRKAGGADAWGIASWDGSQWATYGDGLSQTGATVIPWQQGFAVGGGFGFVGDIRADGVGIWDGTKWGPLRSGHGVVSSILDLLAVDDGVIAAGTFTSAGGEYMPSIAKWDGSSWTGMGANWQSGWVEDLVEHEGEVYAVGPYIALVEADTIMSTRVARFDGANWHPIGRDWEGAPYCGTSWRGKLALGGSFVGVDGVAAGGIVTWDGERFEAVAQEHTGSLNSMATYQDNLVIGGTLQSVDGERVFMAGVWDGIAWTSLEAGGWVGSLLVFGDELIVGGHFNVVGPSLLSSRCVGSWNGSAWTAMGEGLTYDELRPTEDGGWTTRPTAGWAHGLGVYNGELYVTGEFDRSGDTVLNNVARWDGENWLPLGSGIETWWEGRALVDWAGSLFVGGDFRSAGGKNSADFAQWTAKAPSSGIPPTGIRIDGVRPNPMNPETTISFSVSRRDRVTVDIFDARGRRVARLLDEVRDAGPGSVVWQGLDAEGHQVASGVYFVRVRGAGSQDHDKVTLVK